MFNKKQLSILIFILTLSVFLLPLHTSASIKQYYLNEVFDAEQKVILGYQSYDWSSTSQSFSKYADVSRRQYLVSYNNDCPNLSQYKSQYIDIDVGDDNTLDGVSDKIFLPDGEECGMLSFADVTTVYGTNTSRVMSSSQDITPPQPPRSCVIYSDGSKTSWLLPNSEYTYRQPLFEWFGTIDNIEVAGYYILLSKDLNADPFLIGIFQETSSFIAPLISEDGTYYLKIVAKDNAGNLSSDVYCTYKYKAAVQELSPRELFEGTGSTIYYFGEDGKRYVFPTQTTYFSWYNDFSGIKNVTDSAINSVPFGGNITIKPGKLIQFVSMDTPWRVVDPRVWAIEKNGALRWVKSADLAATLYGSDWESKIIALPEVFMTNYTIGAEINSVADYNLANVSVMSPTISADKNLIL